MVEDGIEIEDGKIGIEGNKLQCMVTDAGDPNKTEDGEGQCLNGLKKESEDIITVDNEVEGQTNPEREASDPMPIDGLMDEQISTLRNNEGRTSTDTLDEGLTEKAQVDANNEVADYHAPSDVGKVENSAENTEVEVEKSMESEVEGGNSVRNAIEEINDENGLAKENAAINVIAEKDAETGEEEENLVENLMAKQNAENGMEEGSPVNTVMVERNAENCVEGEKDTVKNVMEENTGIKFSAEKENSSERANQGTQFTTDIPSSEAPPNQDSALDKVIPCEDEEMEDTVNKFSEAKEDNEEIKEQDKEILLASPVETETKHESGHSSLPIKQEAGATTAFSRTNQNTQFPADIRSSEAPPNQNSALDNVIPGGDEEMEDTSNKVSEVKEVNEELKEQDKEILLASPVETETKHESDHSSLPIKQEAGATPSSLVRYLPAKAGDLSAETAKVSLISEGDEGTPEDQAAFMQEIDSFHRERAIDFKPPKFYGQPLNCLKLWRAVLRLGGYDRVTGSKLWRQVGESFHPPKTCTTVSWTFRIFYEKSLLEYERHKTQSGELQLPAAAFYEASGADTEGNGYQGSGPGKAKRDAASRAMQGWHVQRPFGNGEVGELAVKDKNINNMAKREKNGRTIGSLKQKRPNEVEPSVKAIRIETSKQLTTTVVDVGSPADWVKVNVRQTKDCFEVYALVPGLLREEVRVQSDPAGRLVITGQPEQIDNPWGITPFKKVISLPLRVDPLQTSAVVSLHGRLFVRVPFEQSNG